MLVPARYRPFYVEVAVDVPPVLRILFIYGCPSCASTGDLVFSLTCFAKCDCAPAVFR